MKSNTGSEIMENKNIRAVFSAALAILTNYLGIVTIPIVILIISMIVDYATGMAAAWCNAELSSQKGIKGIVKKVSYLALVLAAMMIDWLIYCGLNQIGITMSYNVFFAVLVAVWLIVNELISILENLFRIGVPIPNFLTKIIQKIKVTVEEEKP